MSDDSDVVGDQNPLHTPDMPDDTVTTSKPKGKKKGKTTAGAFAASEAQLWWVNKFVMDRLAGRWKYNHSNSSWYKWNGKFWKADDVTEVNDACSEFLMHETISIDGELSDSDIKREIEKSTKRASVKNVGEFVKQAISHPRVRVVENDFDHEPYVINLQNGELDLRDGMLHPHDPEHLHSMCCDVDYDTKATCPEWEKHISTVFDGNAGLIDNVQQILGYSLFFGNPDAMFGIFNGAGRNGKSVTVNTIIRILGTYAIDVNPDCLMETGGNVSSDRIKMKGARLIVASEPADDGRGRCTLATSFIKAATGGDTVSCREAYAKRSFTFKVGGLVIIVTNQMPFIRDQSHAMRSRIWNVPFEHVFRPSDMNTAIKEVLFSERSGIMNWLLAGYRKYAASGRLTKCDVVEDTTTGYLNGEDPYSEFFAAKGIVRGEGLTIRGGDLYKLYSDWCESNMERKIKNSAFANHMALRFEKKRVAAGIVYIGVGVSGQNKLDTGSV